MKRDRYVDFLRALAICLVVLGHWLITALFRLQSGGIIAPELLAAIPWTRWLTLGFQIMPLFFLAGGHAAGGSWARTRAAGGAAAPWVGGRALRLLLPTAAYSGLVLLAVAICSAVGVDPETLALVGWAMAMQFWFLPVYLLLSAVTPLSHSAHRRWGLLVPVAMGVAALLADGLVLSVHAPSYVGLLNYVLVWGVAYQLGFCWRDGLLTRHWLPPIAMAVGGGLAFAMLITFGPFPVSLILVSGETISNTNPPSTAMLAWVVAQVGLCLAAAPVARRLLGRERVWRLVRPVGGASMTLYLWHMLPVLVAAAAFYLTGLAPEPALGSAAWWALRMPWLLVLTVILVGVVFALRPLERGLALLYGHTRPHADLRFPLLLWLGLAVGIAALTRWAVQGFAPDGRFPVLPTLGFALGAALVILPQLVSAGRDREGAMEAAP
ncbi:acyltransferase family protein [Actinacidiphila soli]|uniref:acyltransferase family protein n=1 Tax=Actinacidiphila soli TaxID=2487275 RepID=UPI000FCA82AA|nr:acyltransferase [Actinacidiphila soli]